MTFLSEKVDYVDHGPTGAESSKVVTVDGRQLHARAVLDATGHARRLVEFEEEFTPGYQVRRETTTVRSPRKLNHLSHALTSD